MENTAKDQNKNNEIIITEKKKEWKETGVHCSQKTHTQTHHKHIEKKAILHKKYCSLIHQNKLYKYVLLSKILSVHVEIKAKKKTKFILRMK